VRGNLQLLLVRSDRNPSRSSGSGLVPVSPQKLGRHPSLANGVTLAPWATPVRPVNDRRARLATTLTLTALAFITVTLLTPTIGFALVQWFAIVLAVAVIAVYLRRQYAKAEPHRIADRTR
jgi:hypothetical protein